MKRRSVFASIYCSFSRSPAEEQEEARLASRQRSMQVNETDGTITPSVITFSLGITDHQVVANNGQTVHEYMICPKQ